MTGLSPLFQWIAISSFLFLLTLLFMAQIKII